MCGIAGIVYFSKSENTDQSLIQLMTQSIRHRGPDDEGFLLASDRNYSCAFSEDTPEMCRQQSFCYSPSSHIKNIKRNFPVQLGHRRLSIIDLSPAGHQPMCSPDARYWITFNGEIYNFVELRERLKQQGFSFTSQTDTEVILRAYECWGPQCVNEFNGMWSFVIYDRTENILFGSRDRFGVKPFYYFKNSDLFAFASEQKALLQLPSVNRIINHAAVFDFLVLNKAEAEAESMFKNIFELQPSHSFTLNIKTGDLRIWKYYQLQWNSQFENFSPEKSSYYISSVRELVKKAIDIRLRSDAPVGTCLSGGIDSSTIVCVMNELMKERNYKQIGVKQNAFTVCFDDVRFDESEWAKSVVDKTQTLWHRTFPKRDDFLRDLEHLIYGHDVPIWSVGSYAQYRVMQLAKESGIKVLLDGQGGDELFGGYKHYMLSLLQEYRNHSERAGYRNERKYFNEVNGKYFIPKVILKKWLERSAPFLLKKIFFKDLQFINHELLYQYRERWESISRQPASLNDALQNDFSGNFLKELLLREDRNGMIHSVESRVPFADDIPLIEFMFDVPGIYKIRNAQSKYLLRESFKDILPYEIYSRSDKMGYSSPNNQWLSELREQFRPYFDSSLKDFINLDLLNKQFDSFFNKPNRPENYRAFKFIGFAVWMKVFRMG